MRKRLGSLLKEQVYFRSKWTVSVDFSVNVWYNRDIDVFVCLEYNIGGEIIG